jgi:hypothetical protein
MCFDFRSGPTNPSIVWYEGSVSENVDDVISPVVDSFDTFLDSLLPWEAMLRWLELRDE